eukprot:SAG11_NODE_12245_length_713_cov_1.472313_2_plen_77_part_00
MNQWTMANMMTREVPGVAGGGLFVLYTGQVQIVASNHIYMEYLCILLCDINADHDGKFSTVPGYYVTLHASLNYTN